MTQKTMMRAKTDIHHGSRFVRQGEAFLASPFDREVYLASGDAHDDTESVAVTKDAPVRRGRSPRAQEPKPAAVNEVAASEGAKSETGVTTLADVQGSAVTDIGQTTETDAKPE